MIEFPRKRAVAACALFAGGIFIAVGAIALPNAPLAAKIFFIALGSVLVAPAAVRLLADSPRFRANETGVWFGGRRVVPWSDVKAVFESTMAVRQGMFPTKTSSIAFEFHRRATLLRTPVVCWFAAPFAVGDIDVSPPPTAERTIVMASRIEAMRVAASGR